MESSISLPVIDPALMAPHQPAFRYEPPPGPPSHARGLHHLPPEMQVQMQMQMQMQHHAMHPPPAYEDEEVEGVEDDPDHPGRQRSIRHSKRIRVNASVRDPSSTPASTSASGSSPSPGPSTSSTPTPKPRPNRTKSAGSRPSRTKKSGMTMAEQPPMTPEELFKWTCPFCEWVQKNRRAPDLRRHIRVHTNVEDRGPELACPGGCLRTFSRRDALKRHLNNSNVPCQMPPDFDATFKFMNP